MDTQTVLQTALAIIGALVTFVSSLLLWRFKNIEQALKELRVEQTAIAAKTEAEFRVMSEANAAWRERAVGNFATRSELNDSSGKRIADAIILAANKIMQRPFGLHGSDGP